jgi:hypothetical protein
MSPYLIQEMAALHAADLRREAEAHRAGAVRRPNRRPAAVRQALAAWAGRALGSRTAGVCCPA